MNFGLREKELDKQFAKDVDIGVLEKREETNLGVHPLHEALKNSESHDFSRKMMTAEKMYGSHMAFRLKKEHELLSQPLGFPGVSQNRQIGYDILLGQDTTIGFKDVLENDENTQYAFDMHSSMEKHLEEKGELNKR